MLMGPTLFTYGGTCYNSRTSDSWYIKEEEFYYSYLILESLVFPVPIVKVASATDSLEVRYKRDLKTIKYVKVVTLIGWNWNIYKYIYIDF